MRSRPISASSMKTYLQCVFKYYLQYEDKKPRGSKTNPLAYGTALHEALEELHKVVGGSDKPTPEVYEKVVDKFVRSGADNGLDSLALYEEGRDILISRIDNVDLEEKVLGLELKFELETAAGTPFLGSIDKLVELDEDTVAIIDYKSSKVALTQEEADEDIQLSMYDLAVSMLYPQYTTIICAFDYLRMGEVITHRTPEQRAVFVKLLDATYQSILETKEEDIKPSLNMFCGWCDFKAYCPDHKKMVNDPALLLPRLDGMSDEDFVEAWSLFSAAEKIVKTRAQEFKSEATQRLMEKDTIKGRDTELYITQNGGKSYNSRAVFRIVGPEKFSEMASVAKGGVERHLRDNPHLSEDIEAATSYSFYAPVLRTRKIKPAKNDK